MKSHLINQLELVYQVQMVRWEREMKILKLQATTISQTTILLKREPELQFTKMCKLQWLLRKNIIYTM